MPLYEYVCQTCGQHFELIRKFSDPPVETCPACGGPVRKLFSSPAIQFKGSGWYVTDYGRGTQSKPDGAPKETPAKTDTSAKTETSTSDASKPSKPSKPSSSD